MPKKMEITNDFVLYIRHCDASPAKYAYYATGSGATPIAQSINNSQSYKAPGRGPCSRIQRPQIKIGWTIIFV